MRARAQRLRRDRRGADPGPTATPPPARRSKKISFQFVALEDGTYDVTMLFNGDTVLDAFQVHIDELNKLERSMQHELIPQNLNGEPAKAKFHVPSLLEMLTKELTARRLVLA